MRAALSGGVSFKGTTMGLGFCGRTMEAKVFSEAKRSERAMFWVESSVLAPK